MERSYNHYRHIALVALFSLVWSSAFIAGKLGLQLLGPVTLLAWRFLAAALLLLPLCLAGRGAIWSPPCIVRGLSLGLLNNVLYLGLTFSALEYISAPLVVLIISCAPFITLILARVLNHQQIRWRQLLGVALGFCGVLVLCGWRNITADSLTGILLAAAGTLSFSLATVLFHGSAQRHQRTRDLNFWQSVAGAALLLPLAATLEGIPFPSRAESWLVITYLAVIVTLGGMALWLWLIRTDGASQAASYHLINPFFGMLLAYAVLDTPLRIEGFVGAALVACGLVLISNRRPST